MLKNRTKDNSAQSVARPRASTHLWPFPVLYYAIYCFNGWTRLHSNHN